MNGRKNISQIHRAIKRQLDRYTNFLLEITSRYRAADMDITIEVVRNEFDKEFKRTKSEGSNFMEVYFLLD